MSPTDIIAAARAQALPHVFSAAQESLAGWTVRLGRRPCRSTACVAGRMAALNLFVHAAGLFPRARLGGRSLFGVVAALEYVTATDSELALADAESRDLPHDLDDDGDHAEDDDNCGSSNNNNNNYNSNGDNHTIRGMRVPDWAVRIRADYGGACTKCDERTATSTLFPLEDLLTDLTWELHDQLLEFTEWPRAPARRLGEE